MPAGDTALRAVHGVFQAGFKALGAHKPRSTDAALLLFAAGRRDDLARVREEWRELLAGIEIVEMDADHYTIMRMPAIEAIATRIAGIMAMTDSGTDAGTTGTEARRAPGSDHSPRP